MYATLRYCLGVSESITLCVCLVKNMCMNVCLDSINMWDETVSVDIQYAYVFVICVAKCMCALDLLTHCTLKDREPSPR